MIVIAAAKIIFDAAYELFATDSVAWDVARRISNYMTISAFFTTIAVVAKSKIQGMPDYFTRNALFIRWVCFIIGMLYMTYAGIEFTHLNDTRAEYSSLLKHGYKAGQFYVILISAAIYYCVAKAKQSAHWI
tara:strand:+ start:1142 stop:1537 length:396 start_codon:yes stop_codon:yes gene_type:complete